MRGWRLDDVVITRHAREARERRGIPWEAVSLTLRLPLVVEPHQGRHRIVRGRLALVVADIDQGPPVVVSMLLRGVEERWTDEDARSVLGAD